MKRASACQIVDDIHLAPLFQPPLRHSFSHPRYPTLQIASLPILVPPPCEPAVPVPAPFSSVREIRASINRIPAEAATGIPIATTVTTPSRYHRPSLASPADNPFSARVGRDPDMLVITRPPEDSGVGGNAAAVVHEAQRRARRRALSQRNRASAEQAKNRTKECEVS